MARAATARRAVTAGTSVARYIWTHPANSGQRPAAVLRVLRYHLTARLLGRRTIARLGDRSSLWVDLHRTAAAMVLYANPPDLPEMMAWRRVLGPGEIFIDVGANVGTYTIWAAELGADVIALEPAADAFALLQENLALNGYAARAIKAAAGAACGTARFTAGQGAANRLDPDGSVETDVVTVDSLVGDRVVAGLKVDVEGFELEVLRGCAEALTQQRIRLVQLEWNMASEAALGTDRRSVVELLAGYGYALYRPDAAGRLLPITDPGYGPDIFACPGRSQEPFIDVSYVGALPEMTPGLPADRNQQGHRTGESR
jgi:FkbM family methyltransferase